MLVIVSHLHLSLIFADKARSLPLESRKVPTEVESWQEPTQIEPLSQLQSNVKFLAMSTNVRLRWEWLTMTNTLSKGVNLTKIVFLSQWRVKTQVLRIPTAHYAHRSDKLFQRSWPWHQTGSGLCDSPPCWSPRCWQFETCFFATVAPETKVKAWSCSVVSIIRAGM